MSGLAGPVAGPSGRSLAEAEDRLGHLLHPKNAHLHLLSHGQISAKQAQEYGEQLFAFADTLMASPELSEFCADQIATPETKAELLEKLLTGKMPPELIKELCLLAAASWNRNEDFTVAVETLGLDCVTVALNTDRRTRRVEEELYPLATAMRTDPEASNFLSTPSVPAETRRQMVKAVLKGDADPVTVLLAERATTNLLPGRFRANLNHIVDKIADSRNLSVARVTSPIELTDHQMRRLEKLLTKKFGVDIEVTVSVDPLALGGLRVEVGDRVLDDTFRTRIYDAERRFSQGNLKQIPGPLAERSLTNG